MASATEREPVLLTTYTVEVYLPEVVGDDELDVVLDHVDETLHDGLFRLAQRLEQQLGVLVVAVDEDGSGWVSGDIAVRPSLSSRRARRVEAQAFSSRPAERRSS